MLRAALGMIAFAGCGRVGFTPSADSDGKLDYRDVVIADAPIAYWRLNDTDAVARDETGRFPGTYGGTCTGVAGALSQDPDGAMRFDGTSCLVSLGDVLDFPGNAPFAVEMWVELVAIGGYQVFFMNETRVSPNPKDGYAMLIGPPGVYLERVIDAFADVTQPIPITAGSFHHLVAVYSGTDLAMYIDGAQAGATKPAMGAVIAINADATIGAIPPGFSFVDGTLDEIAIYDHVLAPDRIALHYDLAINGPR